MATPTITGVTSTILKFRKLDASIGIKENLIQLDYGDGSAVYPSGGIPILLSDAGMVNQIEAMIPLSAPEVSGGQYHATFDVAASTLRLFATGGGAYAPLVELQAGSSTPQGTAYFYARGV